MTVLEREPGLHVAPEVALPEVGETMARRDLRDQIAKLEAQLGAAVSAGFPKRLAPPAGRHGATGRLLDLGALERVRDQLADRLRALRREAEALGARQAASRHLLERMRLEPGRYRWVRVYAADLGEPGCQSWQVRPRLGLLGMLMGWWRVKLSSGCPLATCCRLCPARAGRTAVSESRRTHAAARGEEGHQTRTSVRAHQGVRTPAGPFGAACGGDRRAHGQQGAGAVRREQGPAAARRRG